MTQAQLPAHLQNRQVRSLNDRATEGMGALLPPHISIKGNAFTFIDGAGNTYQPIPQFQGVIVDISDVMAKRFYAKDWVPGTDDPPDCWSMNGVGPSRDAPSPQAERCDICPNNERGSKISKLSGASIKACRDEKPIAILIPQMNMIFQMIITPGSFTNWRAYATTLQNYGIEPSLVWTHFSFQPGVNGVMLFGQGEFVDDATIGLVEAANRERKTDAIVGRLDQPRQAALAAPIQMQTVLAPVQTPLQTLPQTLPVQEVQVPAAQMQQVAPAPQFQPPAMPQTAIPSAAPGPAATPQAANPAPRTRGRPRAAAPAPVQMPTQAPAATPWLAPAADGGIPPSLQRQAPAAAPMQAAAGPGGAQPNTFGIQPGAAVNPELSKMLGQLFPGQPGPGGA